MDGRSSVPRNLFGDVPEAFLADLGRVAMLAALLDQRLQDLYVQMTHGDQTDQAGSSGTSIITLCARRLDVFAEDQRDDVAAFFTAALDALRQRNAVLHSLWSFNANGEHGWRYPQVKRTKTSMIAEQNSEEVPRLIADLVALNEECASVMASVRHNDVK